jgi:rare lipoprotein A
MQTTKLLLIMLIGLAIIEFSIVQSSSAATSTKGRKPTVTSTRPNQAVTAKSAPAMQGLAAVYADKFNGRKTASGQRFCQSELTAAHRTLPLGTTVKVTNVQTSKSIEVRINDRGPFHAKRIIDLSTAAAVKVGMGKKGIAIVQLEVVRDPQG